MEELMFEITQLTTIPVPTTWTGDAGNTSHCLFGSQGTKYGYHCDDIICTYRNNLNGQNVNVIVLGDVAVVKDK